MAGRGGASAAVLSGMLALSFYIHNIIITIMSNNAKQENNVIIIINILDYLLSLYIIRQ